MKYLIDGFNLIYKFPHLEEKMYRGELNDARDGLIEILIEFKKIHKSTIRVVFDGKKNPSNNLKHECVSKIDIFYSLDYSADFLIKEFVKSAKYPKTITVITSDKDILFYINRFKAKKIESEKFAMFVNDAFEHEREEERLKEEMAVKMNPEISEEEISYWHKLFKRKK